MNHPYFGNNKISLMSSMITVFLFLSVVAETAATVHQGTVAGGDDNNDIDRDFDYDYEPNHNNNYSSIPWKQNIHYQTTTTTTTATYNINATSIHSDDHRRRLSSLLPNTLHRSKPLRILYTVTTLAEYDEGFRATTKGFDRLSNLLIPVVKDGVESMLEKGYHVDVCIVSYYEMTRPHLLREALPDSVLVRYWDNAAPISYKPEQRETDPNAKLWKNTLALARQHRYVVKDNLMEYDLFLNFEDDMIIHGDMVEHHVLMTQKLYQLRQSAPETVSDSQLSNFFGPLTKDQLKRCYPGLLRVEVLLEEETYPAQPQLDPVPVTPHPDIDPKPCCHLKAAAHEEKRPAKPTSDKLFLWETNIIALGVRHVEGLGWVALLRGPRQRQGEHGLTLSDYWSGTHKKYFGNSGRPQPGNFNMINNQGGWMGTRQQIWEWHTEICLGGFLPPFEGPHYNWVRWDLRYTPKKHVNRSLFGVIFRHLRLTSLSFFSPFLSLSFYRTDWIHGMLNFGVED
jgi:hypothetical protein